MSGTGKCSIPGCNSFGRDTKLFYFPSRKIISQLWVTILKQRYPKLTLSYDINGRSTQKVCRKHFETRFLTVTGKRVANAIPTLFTDEEISSGKPACPIDIALPSQHCGIKRPCDAGKCQLFAHNHSIYLQSFQSGAPCLQCVIKACEETHRATLSIYALCQRSEPEISHVRGQTFCAIRTRFASKASPRFRVKKACEETHCSAPSHYTFRERSEPKISHEISRSAPSVGTRYASEASPTFHVKKAFEKAHRVALSRTPRFVSEASPTFRVKKGM
ncbi:THAP domain-containing protein [Phthorimaea operculella]|nr:THAP domain-containing protein [Phthorimaea operculella]